MTSNADLHARRENAVPRGVTNSLAVYADSAANAEIWDIEGRRYIDFASGISVLNTGHVHPKVRDAVARQLTSTAGAKRSAQFSPDSKEVYYLDRGRLFNVTLEKREPRAVAASARTGRPVGGPLQADQAAAPRPSPRAGGHTRPQVARRGERPGD